MNKLQNIVIKAKTVEKTDEGGEFETWGAPKIFKGIVWSANGQLQHEQYGDRLHYIKNLKIDGKYKIRTNDNGQIEYIFSNAIIKEGDGVCLYVSKDKNPDFKIVSIIPHTPLYVEVEKI